MKQIIVILVLFLVLFSPGCERAAEEEVEEEPIVEAIEEPVIEEELTCPENCDDGDECTEDYCNENTVYLCANEIIPLCCGNDICEITEDSEECPEDCPDCGSSSDECKEVYFDYIEGECKERSMYPCCGNDRCDFLETYESCPDDCDEEELDLADFPDFLDDDTIVVVGNDAPALDVVSATDLVTTLQSQGIVLDVVLFEDVEELEDDAILIGRPCDNPFVNQILEIEEDECGGFITADTGVIKLVEEGDVFIIIAGHGPEDTRNAVNYLAEGKASGQEQVVYT